MARSNTFTLGNYDKVGLEIQNIAPHKEVAYASHEVYKALLEMRLSFYLGFTV